MTTTPRLSDLNPQTSFVFSTSSRTLVAEGALARITAPAADAADPQGLLQREIDAAFARARAAGIASPVVVGSIPFDATTPSQLFVPERHYWLEGAPVAGSDLPRARATLPPGDPGRTTFEDTVRELLDLFRTSPMQKVVLSRALDVALADDVDARTVFLRLLHAHAGGYRFSVPLESGETLVGVSPELLVRKHGGMVTSNPLAGSRPRGVGASDREAALTLEKSAKDLYEHRLVIDQVRDALFGLCHELDVPERPSLLATSALWHLSTTVRGALKDPATNALALVAVLHPTPAVCGYPRELARATIARVEPFDRGLFTGTTGWMDASGDGEWAVTIRCGIVGKKALRVFAGAGIVEGSVPEHEWAETTAKLGPMLRALGVAPREGA